MQVYRGMDIGTAKPSDVERRHLTHHLIDIKEPSETYDVAEFVQHAERLIEQIASRGRLPVVSGGTAFYIRTLLCGLPAAPRADREIRENLQLRLGIEGTAALYRELQQVDPDSAQRIAATDGYRITRALEIYHATGLPRSRFEQPATVRAEFLPLIVGLDRPRDELYRRINLRVARMFQEGLADEVCRLADAGYGLNAPAMRAIGYREFFEHPRVKSAGMPAAHEAATANELQDAVARDSRRYAKRQLTFFRRMPEVTWLAPSRCAALVPRLRAFSEQLATRLDR